MSCFWWYWVNFIFCLHIRSPESKKRKALSNGLPEKSGPSAKKAKKEEESSSEESSSEEEEPSPPAKAAPAGMTPLWCLGSSMNVHSCAGRLHGFLSLE